MTSLLSCFVAALALGADSDMKGLPFGIPPTPNDAVITCVAPPQCLLYVNWAGTASPNPASASETEKMLAEPEVQEFIGGLSRVFAAYLRHTDEEAKKVGGPVAAAPAAQKPAFTVAAADYGDLLSAVLTHPTAIFVSDVTFPTPKTKAVSDKIRNAASDTKAATDDTPETQGGMVVNLGPDAGRMLAKFIKYFALAKKNGAESTVKQIKIDGETWYRTKPAKPGDKNFLTFGFHGKYFVAGTGEGAVEGILARWKSPAPAWLTKAIEQTAVPRRTGIIYLNLKTIREKLLPLAPAKKEVLASLELSGMANVDSLVSTTGLEDQGMVNRVLLTVDGKPRGLLDMVSDRTLAAKDLAPIPRDALLALAARVDLERSFNILLAAYESAADEENPDLRKGIKQAEKAALEGLEKKYGIDIHRVLSSVGDTWCIYNSPVEGEFPLCGWTAVAPVRDRGQILACLDKLCAQKTKEAKEKAASKNNGNDSPGSSDTRLDIRKSRFAEHEIFYVAGQPIVPALCVTDGELVCTLNMSAMKAYLAPRDHHSLASLAGVKLALSGPDLPAALGYCDTPRLFTLLYPAFSLYAGMGSTAAQKMGVELDPTFWPSAPAIRPHLSPDLTTLKRTPQGLELTCRYCLPTGGVNGPLWLIALTGGGQALAFANFMPKPISVPDSGNVPPRSQPAAACPEPPNDRTSLPPSDTSTRIAILGRRRCAPLETWYCGSIRPTVLRRPSTADTTSNRNRQTNKTPHRNPPRRTRLEANRRRRKGHARLCWKMRSVLHRRHTPSR